MLYTPRADVDDSEGFRGRTIPGNYSWESRFPPQEVLTVTYLSPGNTETSHQKTASPGNLNVGTSEAPKLAMLDHSLLRN